MTRRAKQILLVVLITCGYAQATLVSCDSTAIEPMPPLAVAGKLVWQRHNCQACHQLYGMGGFLGPDLTNFASRAPRQRLDVVLQFGSKQMPPFKLLSHDVDGLFEFLRHVDSTGQGQLGPSASIPWWTYRE